jgi:hypothetical protein
MSTHLDDLSAHMFINFGLVVVVVAVVLVVSSSNGSVTDLVFNAVEEITMVTTIPQTKTNDNKINNETSTLKFLFIALNSFVASSVSIKLILTKEIEILELLTISYIKNNKNKYLF